MHSGVQHSLTYTQKAALGMVSRWIPQHKSELILFKTIGTHILCAINK